MVENFLEKLNFFEDQSLHVNLTYYLHDYSPRNATPTITVEKLLHHMVKNKITHNRILLLSSSEVNFGALSKDHDVQMHLRDVAEALIFGRPIPDERKSKSKSPTRKTRKQLEAELKKCLSHH